MQVSLNAIEKVKNFCNVAMNQDYDVSLVSGRYVIDAKSIMGIFSLDLSKPVELCIEGDVDIETVKETFKDFLV